MLDQDGDAHQQPGTHARIQDVGTVTTHAHIDSLLRAGRVVHAHPNRNILADEPETRGLHQFDTTVALTLAAGDEHMQRRVETERTCIGGTVMDNAIGDKQCAAYALGRHVGQRRVQRGKQARAVIAAVDTTAIDEAQIDIAKAAQILFDLGARPVGLCAARANGLARAAVQHHGDDVAQGLAVFTHQ